MREGDWNRDRGKETEMGKTKEMLLQLGFSLPHIYFLIENSICDAK